LNLVVLGDGLLARSIKDVAPDAILLGHDQVEVTSYDSLARALEPHKPDVLINTVAYHNLAKCEDEPMMARVINEIAAGRVASLAPTVYISTDFVFNDDGPHDESLPGERPRSVYGQTKLGGELATLEHGGIVVRVSALFGHHESHKGPSLPDRVTTGFEPLKLPTDQKFSPTYAPDAAARIYDLALDLVAFTTMTPADDEDVDPPEGIYHAANRGSTTWYEFATHVAEVTRHKRVITGFVAHDRLRPTNSVLKSTRLPQLDHWAMRLNEWAIRREFIPTISPLRKS